MTSALAIWALVTLGHFLLTARWLGAAGYAQRPRDEWWFATMVTAIGTLVMALHAAAMFVGISVGVVAALLALGHLGAFRFVRLRPAALSHQEVRQPDSITYRLEAVSIIVLAAITVQWILAAAPSYDVRGTDAPHYHVPNAINLALGRSVFDLSPTVHLYPMVTSTLAAWFIVPLRDPLLIDVTVLLVFLLLLASVARIFRTATGLSGLAWTPWAMLALFATPLFRLASWMGADLMFAATFSAVAALLLAALVDRRLSRADTLLMSLAIGLLIGTKTTGSAAVFFAGLIALLILPCVARPPATNGDARPNLLTWGAAIACVIAAGGIWIVKNWWIWNSPIAPNGLTVLGVEIFRGSPQEPTMYQSVLGDMHADPTYPLMNRTFLYIRRWLGGEYLLTLLPIAFIPVDAALGWRRGQRPRVSPPLAAAALVIGTAIPITWLLIGAPWTSMEITRGFSLRYLQPWFALLPLLSLIAVFPASARWYDHRRVVLVVAVVSIAASLLVLARGERASISQFPPFPALAGFAGGAAAWILLRLSLSSRRSMVAAAWILVAIVSVGFGAWAAQLDRAARLEAAEPLADQFKSPSQRVYDLVLAFEQSRARQCTTRRFFTITRFDEPLGLQGASYTNLVFYAARDADVTRKWIKPLRLCDYIISDRSVLGTEKGRQLLTVLNPSGTTVELGDTGEFVVLGVR
jgi:hypothetical protein